MQRPSSRKRVLKRHGEPVEREMVEWWEYDGQPHLDQTLAQMSKGGVGCGRVELREWVSLAWFEIGGSGDPCHLQAGTKVEQVHSSRGVIAYASKYIAKIEETAPPVGRWWRTFNPTALPWATAVEVELARAQAARLRRAARRYVNQRGKKGREWRPHDSCAWFCQASGWLPLVRDLREPSDPF